MTIVSNSSFCEADPIADRKIKFIIGFKGITNDWSLSKFQQFFRPMQLESLKLVSRKRHIYGVVVRTKMVPSQALKFLKEKSETYLVEFDSVQKPNAPVRQ